MRMHIYLCSGSHCEAALAAEGWPVNLVHVVADGIESPTGNAGADGESASSALIRAARLFLADSECADDKHRDEGAVLLVWPSSLIHREFLAKLRRALDNLPESARALLLGYVLSDWGGVRWAGRTSEGSQSIAAVPKERIMMCGPVWMSRKCAASFVAACDAADSTDPSLLDPIVTNMLADSDHSLCCSYPALVIVDPRTGHRHGDAFAGWGVENFIVNAGHQAKAPSAGEATTIETAGPNAKDRVVDPEEVERIPRLPSANADHEKRGNPEGADALLRDEGEVRVLWADAPLPEVLDLWSSIRRQYRKSRLILNSSREGALTELEMQQVIVLHPSECRRVNPLHMGAHESPETALVLLHSALSEAKQDHTHVVIEPFRQQKGAGSSPKIDKSVDFAAKGIEAFDLTKEPNWPGWKSPIKANRQRPPSMFPPTGARWRCANLLDGPAFQISARFLATVAKETGCWSAAPRIYLPTLCSLQYGFKLRSI